MKRILVVDDHPVVQEGLQHILKPTGEFEVTKSLTTGQQTIQWLRKNACDAVILDVNLPDMDGLELFKRIHGEWSKLPVMIYTMHDDPGLAVRLLKAGAHGYLSKDAPSSELITGLRRICNGGRHVPDHIAAHLVELMQENRGTDHRALTDREFGVFRKLAAGKGITAIAHEMNLSPSTISTYRARIFEKMGFANNAELVRYAMEHRLHE